MSRRAKLPGAEELFRRTTADGPARPTEERRGRESTDLQVAKETEAPSVRKGPKHEQKVTFYCTTEDLMLIETARLKLRSGHRVAADRGRIVRAALQYVLEDFEARGDDSILLRKLTE